MDLRVERAERRDVADESGGQVTVHIYDAPASGGGDAVEAVVDDLTTQTSGFMQASAANGFANTSIVDCAGTAFNFQPEYSTAAAANTVPWTAAQTNIGVDYELGGFEPCTSVSDELTPNPFDSSDTGGTYDSCSGPYETAGGDEGAEADDGLCYQAGDTHANYDGSGTTTDPSEATGCLVNYQGSGDVDFDGSSYWREWPTGPTPTNTDPSSFVISPPTTGGEQYPSWFAQTDVATLESTCSQSNDAGCTVPPPGPGGFYPYWSEMRAGSSCSFEFGNVSSGTGVADFGTDAQYGSDRNATLGYPQFVGPTYRNTCPATAATGPPSATITSPADNQRFNFKQVVGTSFTCAPASGGAAIQSCIDSNGSASPGQLHTATAGGHVYTVTATSSDGQTATATIHYTVVAPPSASIVSPSDYQSYALGSSVATRFSCSDAPGGPGVRSCRDSNGYTGGSGKLEHGERRPSCLHGHHHEQGWPNRHLIDLLHGLRPTDGIDHLTGRGWVHRLRASAIAFYSCADGPFSPGLRFPGGCTGAVADGARFNTSTAGAHTFTVIASSLDGLTRSVTVRYTVTKRPPRIAIVTTGARGSSSGTVVIELRCGAGSGECAGTLTLTVRTRAVDGGRSRQRTLRLASARFALAPGRHGTVKLRLTHAGRVLLRDARNHRLPVTASAVTPAGAARAIVLLTG